MRMIILAAGQGTRLRPLTDDRPKCMVELAGRPLLDWAMATARAAGIDDIVVIGGYRVDRLTDCGARVIANSDFATTNMVRTLFCAETLFGDGFVMSYGDIVYSPDILRRLLDAPAPIAVAVDRDWRRYWERRFDDPLADAETLRVDRGGHIADIGQKATDIEAIEAQYIGLVAFRGGGVEALTAAYRDAQDEERAGRKPFGGLRTLDGMYMTDLLQGLIRRGEQLTAVDIHGGWVEIDSRRDLDLAEELVAAGRLEARARG